MATTNPEVAVSEEELMSLLTDLEAITATSTAAAPAPTVAAEAAPVELDDADLAALEALDEPVAEVEASTPVIESTPPGQPEVVNEDADMEAQLAEIEALASESVTVPDEKPAAEPEAPALDKPLLTDNGGSVMESVAVAKVVEPICAVAIEPMGRPELAPPVAPKKEVTTDPYPLDYMVDQSQFRRDVSVSEANLDNCMMEQASMRAYYGSLAAQAEAQAGRMKARFDVVEAKLYMDHRKQLEALAAAGGPKVTEKAIESAVKTDPRWLKMKNTVIEAEAIAQINKGMAISFGDRRDMLIQLGADRREEGKGQLRVLAAQQEREELSRRATAAAARALG
jgi:hypothetical protein